MKLDIYLDDSCYRIKNSIFSIFLAFGETATRLGDPYINPGSYVCISESAAGPGP